MRLRIQMRIIIISLFGLFLIDTAQAQEEKYVNVFIFDVTGSMIGLGDGAGVDIFDDVKDIAERIVRGYSNDTHLVIIPFGRGVQEDNIYQRHIISDSDREDAIRFIRGLRANEPETWLSYSVRYGVDVLRSLEEEIPDFDDRTQQLLLLTDGRGNGPGDLGENGNFDIETLIEAFRLARSDFPHLFRRFFAVGDIFTDEELNRLNDEGVPPESTNIDELQEFQNVEVRPQRITVYDTAPEFSLVFNAIDTELFNRDASISITSPQAEEVGSAFQISPKSFELTGEQSFDINIVNEQALNRWLIDNEIQSVDGFISISAGNTYFQPESQLRFTYAIEPVSINIDYSEQQIRNSGRVRLLIDNPSDQPFEANLSLISATGGLDAYNYKIDPERIRVEGRERVRLNIEPEDREFLGGQRKELDEAIEGELEFTIIPVTPNTSVSQTDFTVQASVTPDRTGFYLLISFILLLIIILILLTWYYIYRKQQIFGEFQIAIGGDMPQRLDQSAGFFTTSLIIGKDIFGDRINERIVKVSAGPGILTGANPTLTWYNREKITPDTVVETKELMPVVFSFGENSIHITKTDN